MVLATAGWVIRGHANAAAIGATPSGRGFRVQQRRAPVEARGGSRADRQVPVQAGRRENHRDGGHALRGNPPFAGADHDLRQLAGGMPDRMQFLRHRSIRLRSKPERSGDRRSVPGDQPRPGGDAALADERRLHGNGGAAQQLRRRRGGDPALGAPGHPQLQPAPGHRVDHRVGALHRAAQCRGIAGQPGDFPARPRRCLAQQHDPGQPQVPDRRDRRRREGSRRTNRPAHELRIRPAAGHQRQSRAGPTPGDGRGSPSEPHQPDPDEPDRWQLDGATVEVTRPGIPVHPADRRHLDHDPCHAAATSPT